MLPNLGWNPTVHSVSWAPDRGYSSTTNIAGGGVSSGFADLSIPNLHPYMVHTQLAFLLPAL